MARKSSKTAHVLNLLSGGDEKSEQELKHDIDEQNDSPKPDESTKAVAANLQNVIKDTIENTIKDTISDTLKQKEPLQEVNITAAQASIQTSNPITTQAEISPDKNEPQPALASAHSGKDPVAELIKNSLMEEHKEILDIAGDEQADLSETVNSALDSSQEDVSPEEKFLEDITVTIPDEEFSLKESDLKEADLKETDSNEADFEKPGSEQTDSEPDGGSTLTESETILDSISAEIESSETSDTQEDKMAVPSEEPDVPYQYVNVMEFVVKDKVLYYMEQFGMCTCNRCITDTTALSLTNLPSKYVVVDKQAVSPLLNFYLNKFVGQVTVELTKACITVKDFPRHDN